VNWVPYNIYTTYVPILPIPTADIPYFPLITIQAPPIPAPSAGCSAVPTTQHTATITEATYTSTVTDAPGGAVTLYSGSDGQISTYGANTIYEVYIYTTTQSVDVVGQGTQCGVSWNRLNSTNIEKRKALPAAAAAVPTFGN